MAKKVLIIEQSLAVRGVAESLLRQNGFEVVSADSQADATEILRTSKIDLILVSSEITAESGQPLFEHFSGDKTVAAVPILLLHDPNSGPEPGYPPESIITKPFTPRDFLAAIGPFVGSERTVSASEQTPFSGADFEDALIDSALGLDKIEVDDAEIMDDDTAIYRKQNKKGITESLIGLDIKVSPDDTTKAVHGKIESVNVPPDTEDAPKSPESAGDRKEEAEEPDINLGEEEAAESAPDAGMTESSEIEIITDQYGIAAIPETSEVIQPEDEDKAHDYEWFLSELRREASGEKKPEPAAETPMGPQVNLDEKTAKRATPDKPSTSPEKKPQSKAQPKEQPTHGEAIDKFISEFKKEVDRITGETSDHIKVSTIAADDSKPADSDSARELNWEERLEKIPDDQIKIISREIVEAVAKQVARQLAARIDPDVIYHLIKAALDGCLGRQEKTPSPKT